MLYYNYPTNVLTIDEDAKSVTDTVEDVPGAAVVRYFETEGPKQPNKPRHKVLGGTPCLTSTKEENPR